MKSDNSSLQKTRIGILVSGHGRGSNMQALIDGCKSGTIHGDVSLVIGTRSDAPAILRAKESGVSVKIISPKPYPDDTAYGDALIRSLETNSVDLICLAGYMRILPECVVKRFHGRVMNIHPALLPFFGGQGMYGEHVHKAVVDSGMRVSGCTVHFVDENYDTGPIIVQTPVPVYSHDTPETLAARVLTVEHSSYVEAARLFSLGKLQLEGCKVRVLDEDITV